jgi:hypothetical protein
LEYFEGGFVMSINALTNAAIARRPDFQPEGAVPTSLAQIASAAVSAPVPIAVPSAVSPAAGTQTAAATSAVTTGPNTALQTLTTYIPTEVLTLYVSAIAALGPLTIKIGASNLQVGRWLPFWCFLAATPLVVWVAFASKIKVAGRSIPLHPSKWPLWEMTAATIAYAAWTFALPANPFAQESWYSSGLASFLILVVSAGLGIVAPLMQRQLPS